MTVKELKAKLSGLPDDYEVKIADTDNPKFNWAVHEDIDIDYEDGHGVAVLHCIPF